MGFGFKLELPPCFFEVDGIPLFEDQSTEFGIGFFDHGFDDNTFAEDLRIEQALAVGCVFDGAAGEPIAKGDVLGGEDRRKVEKNGVGVVLNALDGFESNFEGSLDVLPV